MLHVFSFIIYELSELLTRKVKHNCYNIELVVMFLASAINRKRVKKRYWYCGRWSAACFNVADVIQLLFCEENAYRFVAVLGGPFITCQDRTIDSTRTFAVRSVLQHTPYSSELKLLRPNRWPVTVQVWFFFRG